MAGTMSSVRAGLLVPAQLYAVHTDASRAAGRFVTAVKKGTPVREAAGPLVEVAEDRPGLLVVDGPRSGLPVTGPQFQLNVPWRRLATSLDDAETFERVSCEALDDAWSFVGLAGSQHQVVRTAAKQLRFLEAARRHWPTLTSVGPRYTRGSLTGESLETLPTLVRFALARQGGTWLGYEPLTVERLDRELDALPGFRVRAALERRDIAAATELLAGRRDAVTLASLAEHFLAFDLDDEACRAVERHVVDDPHGIARDWLAGRGNRTRTVR
jgi:hypothetical protein